MLPYYKIITVPDLDRITQELDQALPEFDLKAVYSFNIVDKARLLELAPALVAWLTAVGLKNNLVVAAIIWAAPASVGVVHTDVRSNTDLLGEAINLPVYNCEKGHSAWYQADQGGSRIKATGENSSLDQIAEYVPYVLPVRRLHLTRVMTAGNPELARVSNLHPIWFNTDIPHTGINTSDKPRIILSMRFNCPLDVDAL
jgi:hypothetical protein